MYVKLTWNFISITIMSVDTLLFLSLKILFSNIFNIINHVKILYRLFHFQRLPQGGDLKVIRNAGVGGIK